MIAPVNNPNKFLAFFMGIIILLIIWLRILRNRQPYHLIYELNPITWKMIAFSLGLVLLSIILKIYLLSRKDRQNLTYDEQKRSFYQEISERIYIKFAESWIVKKINQNKNLSYLIAIIKHKGIFHYFVGNFTMVIMYTKFLIIFKYIAYITSMIFFGRLSLRKFIDYEYQVRLRSSGKLNLLPLLGTAWSKFMYNSVYYIFKFIPILSLNCIGLYEIFVNYELNYFYRSMWILLIPFFF